MRFTKGVVVVFIGLSVLLSSVPLHSQDKNWETGAYYHAGVSVFMTAGKKQKFPGIRAFAGVSLSGIYKNHLMLQYGPALAIYTKSLGANLNPLVGDWQIDFSHTLGAGYAGSDTLAYLKHLRTLHTADYYNLVSNRKLFIMVAANAIFNNHHRNQVVGSATVSLNNVSLNYYNDGPPFNFIPLADNFDRYWTGGGGIIIHRKEGYNLLDVNFDQFTGYTPQLYELANILGINVPLYPEDKKGMPSNFNTSAYQVKVGIDRFLSVDAGVIGNLVIKGKYFGIQDIIHIKGQHSLHPNFDDNRFFIGGTYGYPHKIKLP